MRSDLLAELIVGEMSAGQTVADICRSLGISRQFVYDWREADEAFALRFAAARAAGFDAIADEIVRIADDKTLDPKARRVMTDVRLRLLAKWSSGTYADRLEVNATNRNFNLNVTIGSDPNEAARTYQELMRPADGAGA